MNEQTPEGTNPPTLSTKKPLLPASLTTVTPLSKYLAMALFVVLPFVGFIVGIGYGQSTQTPQPNVLVSGPLPKPDTSGVGQPPVTATATTPTPTVPLVVPPVVKSNPGTIPPNTATPPVTTNPPVATNCAITNCHGLDITCGIATEPIACTMMYQVGDGCRQFASCGEVEGSCQPVLSQKFKDCKSCVEGCEAKNKENPIDMLSCEQTCVGNN